MNKNVAVLSKADDSKADDSKANDSKANDSKADDSKADDSKADDSKANDSKADDSKANDSKADDSKANDSKADDSKAEYVKRNDAQAENACHPGQVLYTDFMKPAGISGVRLAMALRITASRMSEILNGRRGITAESALRLSAYFGTSARFWLDLQSDYDLSQAKIKWAESIDAEIKPLNESPKPAQEPSGSKECLPTPRLEGNEKKLYDVLSDEQVSFDRLCYQTGMDAGALMAATTMLELQDLITVHPGNYFSKPKSKR